MTELNLSMRALHVFGAVLWIGGAVMVAMVAAAAADDGKSDAVAGTLRRLALKVATPGMVLAWIGGLTLLAIGWGGYMRAGWMHTKILLVLIAAGITGVLTGKLRKLANGDDVSPGSLRGLAYALLGVTALALVMVLLGPLFMGGTD